jgi:hypothetical protein|tara:strand:- start:5591 stop:6004 length:414 start_codon:yes stop_codon:yes gene_type:complete
VGGVKELLGVNQDGKAHRPGLRNVFSLWPCRSDVPLLNPSACSRCETGRVISDEDFQFGLICINCGWTTRQKIEGDDFVRPALTRYGPRTDKWEYHHGTKAAPTYGPEWADPRTPSQLRVNVAFQLRRVIDALEEEA